MRSRTAHKSMGELEDDQQTSRHYSAMPAHVRYLDNLNRKSTNTECFNKMDDDLLLRSNPEEHDSLRAVHSVKSRQNVCPQTSEQSDEIRCAESTVNKGRRIVFPINRATCRLLFVLLGLFSAFHTGSAVGRISLIKESKMRDCLDLICDKDAFEVSKKPKLYGEDGQTPGECRACQQCTDNGFSVCAQPRTYNEDKKAFVSNNACECQHSVPKECRVAPTGSPRRIVEPNSKLFHLCYWSVIQKPPPPQAINDRNDVIVTIEQFWLSDYWRSLKLKNLTLYYEFIVTNPDHCEGRIELPKHPLFSCQSSLNIQMYSTPDEGEPKITTPPAPDVNAPDNYEYDDDLPPEVQFERDVFAGAKRVRLYYQVEVERPNQLKPGSNPLSFEDRTSKVTSEGLDFDLHPEIYGDGLSARSKEVVKIVEQDKIPKESLVKPTPGSSKDSPPTPKIKELETTKKTDETKPTEAADKTEKPHPYLAITPVGHHKIEKVGIEKHPKHETPVEPSFVNSEGKAATSEKKLPTDASGDLLPTSTTGPVFPASNSTETTTSSNGIHPSSPFSIPADESTSGKTSASQYRMVRNVFVLTLISCALLVLIICFYRKGYCRRMCGGKAANDRVTENGTKTKNVNGKEYRAADSNGGNS
ncbi:hypothetical protein Ddc_11329 [Ditylenchus destructor]|nr:hypothetical protein Ddc_11329 [Ditylenchus destructor]